MISYKLQETNGALATIKEIFLDMETHVSTWTMFFFSFFLESSIKIKRI